jgi:hypothetical protein
VPVLKIIYIGSIKAVESNDHCIFERLTCFPAFFVISIPIEEIAHAVKFLRHTSFFIIRESRILRKELGYCIQVLLGFFPPMRGLVVTLYNTDEYNFKLQARYKMVRVSRKDLLFSRNAGKLGF